MSGPAGRRVAGLVLALAVAAGPLASGCSVVGDDGPDGYHLVAMFPSAVGLYPFGDVSVMGVGVGTVDAVEIDDDHVRVEMTIKHGIPLPSDVQATIEPLTLIGERNVVLFPPWDAAMAKADADKAQDGDVIPLSRTKAPVEPDEALEAFNDLARSLDPTNLGNLVTDSSEVLDGLGDDLGTALDQAAGITGTLAEVDGRLVDAADSLHVLAGSLVTRETQLGSLVRSFSDVTAVIASEREGIRRFLSSIVGLTEEGSEILAKYGEQLPTDIAHMTALAMLLADNADAAQQLIGAFPDVAEGIARGYQPDIQGIYLRASLTPTLVGLLDVFADILGVLPARTAP